MPFSEVALFHKQAPQARNVNNRRWSVVRSGRGTDGSEYPNLQRIRAEQLH